MTRAPWHGGSFDLPDEPTDGELRRALRVLVMGGSLGGSTLWGLACTRWLRDIGPAPDDGGEYERVAKIGRALQPPPTGILARAGRRGIGDGSELQTPMTSRRAKRDIIPPDATDEQIREAFPKDAETIIAFRRQLDQLSTDQGRGG